jgi:SAM-dependent methyltransferase
MTSFARFYRGVQDTAWYLRFLETALPPLASLPSGARVLDVGTGPGKLLERIRHRYPFEPAGVDTDPAMIAQARRNEALRDVPLRVIVAGRPLPFPSEHFHAVCATSVLFLLDDPLPLLNEINRILKPGGRLVALTPDPTSRHVRLTPDGRYYLWRRATRKRARRWQEERVLEQAARQYEMSYHHRRFPERHALLECLFKPA